MAKVKAVVDISASMVKELRERTGAAMMDCKKALVEAQGDFEKAFEVLRRHGAAEAAKRATREVTEGLVAGQQSPEKKRGTLVEIACETDFVARNPEFVRLAQQVCSAALSGKPASTEQLLSAKINGVSIAEHITTNIAKTGENIVVRRCVVLERGAPGIVGMYLHALGGKMGALVDLESSREIAPSELEGVARDIAMHVVSAKPLYIDRAEVPGKVLENEQRIESGKSDLAGKKPELRDKIIAGRVDKIIAERCLIEQPFIKDPTKTIGQYLKEKGAALGAQLKPVRFALFILGETSESQDNNGHGA